MSEEDSGGQGGGARVARRLLLKTLATSSFLLEPACGPAPLAEDDPSIARHAVSPALEVETPIERENRLPGTTDYLLTQPALDGEVEGYASRDSVAAGDILSVFVNVARAQGVRGDVYRIGYYHGLGARLLRSLSRVPVSPQPVPIPSAKTGLIECAWQSAFELEIESGFVNGYYLCKLTNDDGFESYVPFIVRESGRIAPLLVKANVTTWQAYNRWGNVSLYVNRLPDPVGFRGARGYQVSFDRPYAPDTDIGSVEWCFVRYLEQNGYDIGYVTNVDLDRSPELLQGRLLFATSGHDEYWSLDERNAIQSARDAGLSIAFFSGNTAYRRVRLESSSAGVDRRIITCYKSGALDPVGDSDETTADTQAPPKPRPENQIVGVLWAGWANLQGFPFLVADPAHWIYEGTGVMLNDTLANVVGYEWDVVSDNGEAPAGLEIVGDSIALHEYGYNSRATATVYYPTQSSFVFGAGTIGWANGLAAPAAVTERLQRVTENILARAGLFPRAPLVVAKPTIGERGASERARVLAGNGTAGFADGPGLSAQFSAPGGVAASPSGELIVCDTGNHLLRKVSSSGVVSTLVGAQHGKLRLNTPTGVVVDATGTIFFSDTNNHRLVCFDEQDGATVLAGGRQGFKDNRDLGKASFNGPRGLALDAAGALYVADFGNNAIRRIDAAGVTTLVSQAGGPSALAIAGDGTLYYVATWSGSIVRVAPDGTQTVLANASGTFGNQDGPGASALLRPCEGLCLDAQRLVFSDTGNNRIRMLEFDAEYTVSTLLGTGQSGSAVGTGADTQLMLPRGLSAFGGGYVVADSANHRILWFGPGALTPSPAANSTAPKR